MEDQAGAMRMARKTLDYAATRRAENTAALLARVKERMAAISPIGVLNRGYALIYAEDGAILTRKAEADLQDRMKVRFADGEIEVERYGK